MANQYVQVPSDGAGKKIQTFENTVGGQVVQASAVALVKTDGSALDGSGTSVPVGGDVAHDSADSGFPTKLGGKASTTLPTAVSDADRVNAYFNEYGEQVQLSGGFKTSIQVSPTVDTSIYAAGDAVGGLLTFTSAARKSGGSGRIKKVTLMDLAKQSLAMDLVLFNQTFTATADQAVFDPLDAELPNCIGVISLVAGDYAAFNDNSLATKAVDFPFVCSGTANLYGQLVARGTPTFAAATDVKVRLDIEQD